MKNINSSLYLTVVVLITIICGDLLQRVDAEEVRDRELSFSWGKIGLPGRPEILIQHAWIMTMDENLGEIPEGDIHIRDGKIIAIGTNLTPPGADVIDGRNRIVLPGFIETHWHMWNSLLRSMSGDKPEHGYFPMRTALGMVYQPRDNYLGVWFAAAEAITAGITFVNNWSHNIRSPAHAEEELRALRESGLRARFSYGPAAGQDGNQPVDLPHIKRLSSAWRDWSADGLIDLGLAWRGMPMTSTSDGNNVGREEFNTARRLGLPISIHAGSRPTQAGEIENLAASGLLGPDVLVIHATSASNKDIEALVKTGSPVSLSPFTEMRIGYGLPPVARLLDAGVVTSLSVDTTALSGNADMFAIMKILQNLTNGMSGSEFTLTAKRLLEIATIEGARAMGVDQITGSLKPGKRADLIMISVDAINLGVMTRPDHLLVEAAQPANVETVIIDGRILKRDGVLTAVDMDALINAASTSFNEIKQRAGRD